MTLSQAIKDAQMIWIFNGEMELRINKQQAHDLRKQSIWSGPKEDCPDVNTWTYDGVRLNLHWES